MSNRLRFIFGLVLFGCLSECVVPYVLPYAIPFHSRDLVSLSVDGKYALLNMGEDNLQIIDAQSYAILANFKTRITTDPITFVFFSGSARFVDSGGFVVNTQNGDRLAQLQFIDTRQAYQISASKDNQFLAIGASCSPQVWDLKQNELLHRFTLANCQNERSSVAISPDGTLLAVATGSEVQLYELQTAKLLKTFTTPVSQSDPAEDSSIALSPDNTTLLIGSYGGPARFIDISTGQATCQVKYGAKRVTFSPDGSFALMVDSRFISWWDVKTCSEKHRIDNFASGDEITQTAFSSDSKTVLAAIQPFIIKRWDVETGNQLTSIPYIDKLTLTTLISLAVIIIVPLISSIIYWWLYRRLAPMDNLPASDTLPNS